MVRYLIAFLFVLLVTVSPAQAQTDPSLAYRPWAEHEHIADTFDEPVFIYGGYDRNQADEKIDTLYYDSYGRVKLQKEKQDPDVYFGYRILSIGIDSSINALPTGMNDISIVGAWRVGDIAEGMTLNLMAGAGMANDNHFDNNSAYYPIGAVTFTNKIDENSKLHWGIGYDGNRSLLPDAPLPYISYETKVNDQFSLLIGVPRSSVVYKPWEKWTFEFEYQFPVNATATASYDINEKLQVFGLYDQSFSGVYLNDQGNNRLFYQLKRAQTGLRFRHGKLIDIAGGVGWAFDQDYRTGYDLRDTGSVATPSDNVLFFIRLQGTF